MALVSYLDWEVRTTGHDLNCSGFNPNRDTTNGVDYTQQDNAEITSLNWVVDSNNNTWIRSEDLTNWVNSGKTLVSLKGNHIHIAGMAIAGGVLFDWVASTGKPGAYYLQAKGGGNPNWTTKPTRVWLNKVYTPENTNLPSGSNTWAWGDWDSLGYNTIYVRFGAESDVDPSSKNQDDVIADGRIWSRGAYEIINVGSDANGPYLVLDRSPAAVNSQGGYGRIGGAIYSAYVLGDSAMRGGYDRAVVRPGEYYWNCTVNVPNGFGYYSQSSCIVGQPYAQKYAILDEDDYPIIYINSSSITANVTIAPTAFCKIIDVSTTNLTYTFSVYAQYCCFEGFKCILTGTFYGCRTNNCRIGQAYVMLFSYCKNSFVYYSGSMRPVAFCCIFDGVVNTGSSEGVGGGYTGGTHINCVVYNSSANGFIVTGGSYVNYLEIWDGCLAVNCARYGFMDAHPVGRRQIIRRCFAYNCTLGSHNSGPYSNEITTLSASPFRDPANGDFRLADNEAGRMLKQAGFQIPGPQGAPPLKFDVGAVQNSFYDYIKTLIPSPIYGT